MTYPRSHLVDPDGGTYHVQTRCVRRAFLCGTDTTTGRSFDHRRLWLEDLILSLATFYTIDIYAYAVMSNHYHIVLNVNSNAARALTNAEVVIRWLGLTKPALEGSEYQLAYDVLMNDAPRITVLRHRLGSLSSFMARLNETVAKKANKEDHCKGHFWEQRFQSQRILDERGLAATMVYSDLNPVRAYAVADPTEAEFTSLCRRLALNHKHIQPLNAPSGPSLLSITLEDYIELCRWTANAIPAKTPSSVKHPNLWRKWFLPRSRCWPRAIGSREALADYASQMGLKWIRGAEPV